MQCCMLLDVLGTPGSWNVSHVRCGFGHRVSRESNEKANFKSKEEAQLSPRPLNALLCQSIVIGNMKDRHWHCPNIECGAGSMHLSGVRLRAWTTTAVLPAGRRYRSIAARRRMRGQCYLFGVRNVVGEHRLVWKVFALDEWNQYSIYHTATRCP